MPPPIESGILVHGLSIDLFNSGSLDSGTRTGTPPTLVFEDIVSSYGCLEVEA